MRLGAVVGIELRRVRLDHGRSEGGGRAPCESTAVSCWCRSIRECCIWLDILRSRWRAVLGDRVCMGRQGVERVKK